MARYPDRQRSRAVLIGTSDYEHPDRIARIPAIHGNLIGLEAALTNPATGVFDQERCFVVDNPDSPRGLMGRLSRAANEAEDVLLVYYAGHGELGWGGDLHLTVRETDPQQLAGTAVPFAWIRDAIQNSPASVRILILDCCFSGLAIGTMAGDAAALGQVTVAGTFILTSTTANQVSVAVPGETYSAFTAELIKLLTADSSTPLLLSDLHRPLSAAMALRRLPAPRCSIADSSGSLALRRPRAEGRPPEAPEETPPEAPEETAERALDEPAAVPGPARLARLRLLADQRRLLLDQLRLLPGRLRPMAHRWRALGGALIALGVLAAAGYWICGPIFAGGPARGVISLALAGLVITLLVAAARGRPAAPADGRRARGPRSGSRRRSLTAAGLAVVSLAAGTSFGQAAVGRRPCGAPTQLLFLVSPDVLGAMTMASTVYDQDVASTQPTKCSPVSIFPYPAPSDSAAQSLLTRGNGAMAGDGPPPDMWAPGSTAAARITLASGTARKPWRNVRLVGSIAESPLVVGVPHEYLGQDHLTGMAEHPSWSTLDQALSGTGLVLPSPLSSVTGLLGISGLLQDPGSSAREAKHIAASGDFPSDDVAQLCGADQAAAALGHPANQADLVSAAALLNNDNAGQRAASGACADFPTGSPPLDLKPFYPAGPGALDFPFYTVRQIGSPPVQAARLRYELAFYRWLTSATAARKILRKWNLRPAACASCASSAMPSVASMSTARQAFFAAKFTARILIGVDDSGAMGQYQQGITYALNTELNTPHGALGNENEFGIVSLAGRGSPSGDLLMRVEPAASAVGKVDKALATTESGGSAALYAMLTAAAHGHVGRAGAPGLTSIVLLTNGDGFPNGDPDQATFQTATELLHKLHITVSIIAFPPLGCAESSRGPGQTLLDLAAKLGGHCKSAEIGSLPTELGQQLGQLALGG